MRKADYQHLAQLIHAERAQVTKHPLNTDCDTRILNVLASLARKFAARASVDRAAFLRACGLPD